MGEHAALRGIVEYWTASQVGPANPDTQPALGVRSSPGRIRSREGSGQGPGGLALAGALP